MITVAEASEKILARIGALSSEPVATVDAAGRVLSERLIAPIDSPPWDNSSMDGFAVRSTDVSVGASLPVVGEIAAGGFPARGLERGQTMKVMTGAPVPDGADSVIRREDTDEGEKTVTIRDARDTGKNIRRKGEDFHAGDLLFAPGEALSPAHIGAIASAGIKTVPVHRRPRVAIISSGDELVPLDDFSTEVAGKKIVCANSITLSSLVERSGGHAADIGISRDDRESLREKFEQARHADLIVTSAGISVGDHDHVRDVFAELGGELVFWKVRMRPGAPLAFGMLDGVPWIGLSGNPVSAIVTFELFVRPLMRKMLGLRHLFRKTVPVTVAQPITLAAPLMHFLRVIVTETSDGTFSADLAGSQSSAVLTAMARANALLILSGESLSAAPGERHRALPLWDSMSDSATLQLT